LGNHRGSEQPLTLLNSAACDFAGPGLDSNGDVVVKYTYNGDATLDDKVNADDYFRIDSGFLDQPANPLYAQGDFNYDDRITADDYFLIDSAFLSQGPPLESGIEFASVPDPAFAAPLPLLAGALLLRHRRVYSSKNPGASVTHLSRRAEPASPCVIACLTDLCGINRCRLRHRHQRAHGSILQLEQPPAPAPKQAIARQPRSRIPAKPH
jgi:hypothetical protein